MIINNVVIYNGETILHLLRTYVYKISGEGVTIKNNLFIRDMLEANITKCLSDEFGLNVLVNEKISVVAGLDVYKMLNHISKSEHIPIWLMSKGISDISDNVKIHYMVDDIELIHVEVSVVNDNIHIHISIEIGE